MQCVSRKSLGGGLGLLFMDAPLADGLCSFLFIFGKPARQIAEGIPAEGKAMTLEEGQAVFWRREEGQAAANRAGQGRGHRLPLLRP
jgi:hypothetical protein